MPIFVITPLLGWAWPSLAPLVVAVASGYGYKKLTDPTDKGWLRGKLTAELENLRRVSLPIDEVMREAVGDEVGRDERLVFEKDDYRLIFRRDIRGKFFVEVLGPVHVPANVLRKEALDFARELVQQFVYNRVVREMENRGLTVVDETVEESGDIEIQTRRYR